MVRLRRTTQRWLVVRTNTDTITEYLAGHLDLLTILAKSDFGLLVDQNDGKTVNVRQITVSTLPQNYLPMPHAVHDKSLRPA